MRNACHDAQADQYQNTYADPLRRNMREMRSRSQSRDEHDEAHDVKCKGHVS